MLLLGQYPACDVVQYGVVIEADHKREAVMAEIEVGRKMNL